MSTTVFDTPLDARSLVEASAGTGKTYALAGLFARAVIVDRLRVPQVLAVTFTVAATGELQARVLVRLRQAVALSRAWATGDPPEREGDPPELAMLRRMVHDALGDGSGETAGQLQQRLARAVRDMDLAAITTIHGFCQRLLGEHALEVGQSFAPTEIVAPNEARRTALAVAAWRRIARTPDGAGFLQRVFCDVDGLADALRHLLAPEPLLPSVPPGSDACVARANAWRALRASFVETGDAAREVLLQAIRDRTLSSAKDRTVPVEDLWRWFGSQGDTPPPCAHPQLERLGRACIEGAMLKSAKAPMPELPLCVLVDEYLTAAEVCDVQAMHALRETVRALDARDKAAFNRRDFDDLVDAVHGACADPALAKPLADALRAQFPLVLVDEFQDTDARQWRIFEHLFGSGGLILVGDPKQAIYRFRGGDVETYLTARATAGVGPPLRENFRSRPALLSAVNAMFEDAPDDGLGPGIAFAPSAPGGRSADDDLQLDGAPAPAITFHAVPAATGKKGWNKDDATEIAAALCADRVRDWLAAARAGRATRLDQGARRAVLPRDCAVLVRTHVEARAIRDALAARGVSAVSAGRASLFESPQAHDLLALLLALASPGDERRLRGMLATPLFGLDAAELCALEADGDALRGWQERVVGWRLRWDQHGPQAMLAEVVASQAARLLPLADGERALTHLLQLGELMQEARSGGLGMRGLGPQGQVDWLRTAIASADKDDERQWPRLESDAGRVQVMTLHASKGLEFPLVFLPFSGIGRGNGNRQQFVDYHDDDRRRVRQWKTRHWHGDAPAWDEACTRARREEEAEDMRLLYVGMTRAREALWLCGGHLPSVENSALRRLLGGAQPGAALVAALGSTLASDDGLPPQAPARLESEPAPGVPAARRPQRPWRRDWWVHSFSQLHRQRPHGAHAMPDESPAADEVVAAPADAPVDAPAPSRIGGIAFGNALHDALEHGVFELWRDHDGHRAPPGEEAAVRAALQRHGYGGADLDAAQAVLVPLVARTLNAPLPLGPGGTGVRLCDLPAARRVAEMEFHFTLADADAGALLSLLHAHGIAAGRRDFGAWPRLSGLMTGKVDLTCESGGRVHVLDYKSNRLPDYDAATLGRAMAASEYDLQALLYVVALHRWLFLRRGQAYDYVRDVGGAHYIFSRGLDPDVPANGLVSLEFAPELVEGVAMLLSGGARA